MATVSEHDVVLPTSPAPAQLPFSISGRKYYNASASHSDYPLIPLTIEIVKPLLLTIFLALPIVSLPAGAQENTCPDWITDMADSVPFCPKDNTVVPETFPTAAVVVSDKGQEYDSQFTARFVEKVLTGAGENLPLVVLPVRSSTYFGIQQHIDSLDISDLQKRRWKRVLRPVWAESFTWQQDYFEAFADSSGKVVLRQVEGYSRARQSLPAIAQALKNCGFRQGEDLKTTGRGTKLNGYTGGNIEGLPGGFCLLGDSHFKSPQHWEDYADQFCGQDRSNRIKVPTSWLSIGHTDEIVKVVPNTRGSSSCGYSISVASPAKAIELLQSQPDALFLQFPAQPGRSATELAEQRLDANMGLKTLCRIVKEYSKPDEPKDCAKMTNRQVLRVFEKRQDYREFTRLVQDEMDSLKRTLTKAITERNRRCRPDFIDVPDLFYGYAQQQPVRNEDGSFSLRQGSGASLLPNPTNAVSVGNSVITPEPGNTLFKKYIAKEYAKRGVESHFVDSFDYAHMGQGNLHCASHTIHICRPRR